ncbi:hypothetical protein M514_00084 [Trichuris suis]|uniref:Uncharacterized protein n=1 Tax=Trichuris suis TaxID=68888 RepID=A0A085MNX5_9BILA|nr:hypothetical protein M513_00084 [Trichuris suis]KFD72951.1 hypothetical protein M514_00084 [Trichuris suis]
MMKSNKDTQSFLSQPPKILDVQQVIEDYAWHMFDQIRHLSKGRNDYRGIERSDLIFEVNTNRLTIEHLEPEFTQWGNVSTKPYTLFRTFFKNATDREQAYSFKAERATESVCLVFREQGFDMGAEAELTLNTPCEILEFKAGFKYQIHVNKGQEQAQVESIVWGVDSAIVVPAKYETVAELKIEERVYKGNFTVMSRLSGIVCVVLRRSRNNEIIMPFTANVVEIFNEMKNQNSAAVDRGQIISIQKSWVIIRSTGRCTFQFASNQTVALSERPLPR